MVGDKKMVKLGIQLDDLKPSKNAPELGRCWPGAQSL